MAIARVDPMGGPDVLVADLARRVQALEGGLRWTRAAVPAARLDAGTATRSADVLTVDAPDVQAQDAPRPVQDDVARASAGATDAPPAPTGGGPDASRERSEETRDASPAPTAAPRDPPPAAPAPSGGAANSVLERQGAAQGTGAAGWLYQPAPFAQPGGYGSLAPDQFLDRLLAWLTDGVLFIGLLALGILFVLRRRLRESPRWVARASARSSSPGSRCACSSPETRR
ncbi:MAG: hypothetical protein R3A48_14330 [Polyangiales bacterium]